MKQREKTELYHTALATYGVSSQQTMLYEECGELINALAKFQRGRVTRQEVITELADVAIMVEQMAQLFGLPEYQAEKERKLLRLQARLVSNANKSNK